LLAITTWVFPEEEAGGGWEGAEADAVEWVQLHHNHLLIKPVATTKTSHKVWNIV
jgi:hypothetical protein